MNSLICYRFLKLSILYIYSTHNSNLHTKWSVNKNKRLTIHLMKYIELQIAVFNDHFISFNVILVHWAHLKWNFQLKQVLLDNNDEKHFIRKVNVMHNRNYCSTENKTSEREERDCRIVEFSWCICETEIARGLECVSKLNKRGIRLGI